MSPRFQRLILTSSMLSQGISACQKRTESELKRRFNATTSGSRSLRIFKVHRGELFSSS